MIDSLPPRTAAWLLALFAAAFLFYTLAWRRAPVMEGDSPQYLEVAQDLSDFRLDALHDRTPGYPLLLRLTGSTTAPTRTLFFASLLLHFASIWLLAVILRAADVSASRRVLCAVVLLLPPYVEPAAHVMTENLAQFMLVLGLACLVSWLSRPRAPLLAISAAAFAYAALTRPVYQALTVVIAIGLIAIGAFSRRTRLSFRAAIGGGSALVLVSALVLGGLAVTNLLRFGSFAATPTLGFHLSTKTMTFVERLPDEYAAVREILIRERDAELTRRGGVHTGTQAIWGVRSELAAATGLSQAQLSSYLVRMNLRLIARAPLEYLTEVGRSVGTYWLPMPAGLASMKSSVLRWTWAVLHLTIVGVFFLQLAVLGGVALFDASRRGAAAGGAIRATAVQRQAYALAGIIVFYTMILSCTIDIGEPRQRLPTDALIIFMCFLGAQIWRQSREA